MNSKLKIEFYISIESDFIAFFVPLLDTVSIRYGSDCCTCRIVKRRNFNYFYYRIVLLYEILCRIINKSRLEGGGGIQSSMFKYIFNDLNRSLKYE